MKIGFIGVGTMGSSMASNLLAAGHTLCVHDVRREAAKPHLDAGAAWAADARAVADGVEVVFTSLPGPREVEAVASGLLEGMKAGTAWFDLSTNDPNVMRRLHQTFAARGVAVLDAIGDQAHYVGPIGAGSVAKLVHNCAGYILQTALAEVFTMGVKAGVEPLAIFEAVRQGALGRRRTFEGLVDQFLPGKYEPAAFALRLAHKDVTLATALGRDVGVPMRLANLALAELTEALNRGWADRDSRVAMLLQEERAGVEIRVPEDQLRAALAREPV